MNKLNIIQRAITPVLAASVLVFAFGAAVSLFAGDETHAKSVDQVLGEIRREQGVGSNNLIDPDKVGEEKLEELGEAVMDYRFPDQREHEWMDRMMGGEGSESLDAMHRVMGYRYLAGDRYPGWGPRGGGWMMGPGMMGWMGPGMHGGGWGAGPGWGMGFGLGGILLWLLLIGLIVLVVLLIVRTSRRPSGSGGDGGDSALEIAKQRYARGEISKQDYEQIRRDLS